MINLKKTLFFLAFVIEFLMLNACNNSQKAKQLQDSVQKTQKEIKAQATSPKTVEAIYQNCTVYTGSVDYFFVTEQKDTIKVNVLKKELADAETLIAKVPDNLIEDTKNLEGLPGANPQMVGKRFSLIYNDQNEVIEIKPAK
ncbi:MAG: hypothetical protein MUE85_23015 [Microscillaceae bacterium]|jgi:hypothetical protein|nr:hypothetical protein [Microscillaceae bacterium]